MGVIFSTKCEPIVKPNCDLYRQRPLRLLGYATHVGNACSAIIPGPFKLVPHMITTAYIMGDVFDKASKTSERGYSKTKVISDAGDAAIWQMLSSVLIPGFVISQIKNYIEKATEYTPNSCEPPPALVKSLPPSLIRALPCIIGILAIPLLMYPIDLAVDTLMDVTYRPIFYEETEEEKKIRIAKEKAEAKKKPPVPPQKKQEQCEVKTPPPPPPPEQQKPKPEQQKPKPEQQKPQQQKKKEEEC